MRKKILSLILLFCILLSSSGCSDEKADSTFSIQFIDVGQGDSALVECDGHYMLIDGGDTKAGDTVYEILRNKNIRKLDILVASHLHEDHIGGLCKALTYSSTIDLTLCNSDYNDSECFADFNHQLSINNSTITVPMTGDKYKLGNADVEIIDIGSSGNESIVLLITYKKTRFLFTGDIEQNMESQLCDKYGDELPIDLLKVAHHGSDTSTSIRFLRMLMPQHAVISVGKNNNYGHPAEQTLSRLDQANVKVYRTDFDGDIFAYSNGKSISIDTEK